MTTTNQTLALRYRPRVFEDLAGHGDIVNKLKGVLKKQNLPNALLLSGLSGTGKCVTGDTLINTVRGLVPIKELISKEGYRETGYNNQKALYNAFNQLEIPSHTYKRKARTIKITTSSGRSIEGTYKHPLLTIDHKTGRIMWKKLKEITTKDYLIHPSMEGSHPTNYLKIRFQNKLYTNYWGTGKKLKTFKKPEVFDSRMGTIMGLLVSEGSLSNYRVSITNNDPNVINLFKDCFTSIDPSLKFIEKAKCEERAGSIEVRRSYNVRIYTEACGLVYGHCRNVEVPSAVLKSPEDVRSAYLRAYFEGDGGWEGHNITCSSASKKLLQQTQILLSCFGIHSRIGDKLVNEVPYYVLIIPACSVDLFMEKIGFLSDRKNNMYVKGINRNTNIHVIPESLRRRIEKWQKNQPEHKNGKYRDSLDRPVSLKFDTLFNGSSVETYRDWFRRYASTAYKCDSKMHGILRDLEYLTELDCMCSKVTSVTYTDKRKWVYDFTLPRTHSFMGGGFVNHNTTLARMFARYLNCQKDMSGCGECESCRAFDRDHHPDYMEINCGTDGGIDNIRNIIAGSKYKPRYRIRVITLDEAHRLTPNGAQGLLVPLESPCPTTLWILATTDPDRIPNSKAVTGRCAQLILTPPNKTEIARRLRTISKSEGLDWYTGRAGRTIAEASGGHVRDAVQILEACDNYISGLEQVPDKKELIKTIENLAVKNVDQNIDRDVMRLMCGIYGARPEQVQKVILDTEADYIGLINKALYVAYFMVNYLAVGKHKKIWWTPLNKGILKYLQDKKIKLDLGLALEVHKELSDTRTQMQNFSIGAEHVLTSRLTLLALDLGSEK